MKLTTQIALAFAAVLVLVASISVTLWARQLEVVVTDDARDEAAALAATLASAHASNVSQRNVAVVQLDFEMLAARVPDDIAYVAATDARLGGEIVAAVPPDLIGRRAPDVVPLAITLAAERAPQSSVTETFLLRSGAGTSSPGDPVLVASEVIRQRDGTVLGTLYVGVRSTRREVLVRGAVTQALIVAAVLLVTAFAVAAFVSRRVVAPIAALRARMAGVAEGALEEHVVPANPVEVRELAVAYNGMVDGLKKKRALERYVPVGARKEIEARVSAVGVIEPRRERVVVLFADLRGFSTMSEKATPEEVLAILNDYSDTMSEIVTAENGDVIELLGDAVLAVFTGENAAASSVACSSRMQQSLGAIAGGALRMGVGLHLGEVVLGTVGRGERLKFAVVGDSVNVAARIQEKSKGSKGSAILVSDEVKVAAGSAHEWVDHGPMEVRGRAGGVHLWELDSPRKTD